MDSNDKTQTESTDEPVRKRIRPGKYVSTEYPTHFRPLYTYIKLCCKNGLLFFGIRTYELS